MYSLHVKGCLGLANNARDEDSTELFHKILFVQFYKVFFRIQFYYMYGDYQPHSN